jgi:hypothetical protein
VWLPEQGELCDAEEARALLAALRDFCAWVETAHEVPLAAAYGEHVTPLEEALPRIAEANRHLPAASGRGSSGWFAITSVGPGRLTLEDERGRSAPCSVPAELARELRAGDMVRASSAVSPSAVSMGGELAVLCAYPARARDLAQGAPAEA